MSFETKYIKIDDAIKVIDKAEKEGIINRITAEEIIHRIYKATEPSKYKKPEWKGEKRY